MRSQLLVDLVGSVPEPLILAGFGAMMVLISMAIRTKADLATDRNGGGSKRPGGGLAPSTESLLVREAEDWNPNSKLPSHGRRAFGTQSTATPRVHFHAGKAAAPLSDTTEIPLTIRSRKPIPNGTASSHIDALTGSTF